VYCQLQLVPGCGSLTSLSSFHAGTANGSIDIDGETRLKVVLHLSAVASFGGTGCKEPRPRSQEDSRVESPAGIM